MTLCRAALALADRGIPVFPCHDAAERCSCGVPDCSSVGKHPRTPRGLHDASADPATIEAWWRRWPLANVAIPTGQRSGLLVIDVDRKRGAPGDETLAALEGDVGALPPTLTATTPSGGGHIFFRMPAVEIRNSAGRIAGEAAPGVDVRGEGGYVLVAPSSIRGQAYAWRERRDPVELPARWLELLAPPKREAPVVEPWTPRDDADRSRMHRWCVSALEREARDLAHTPAGRRNDELWRSTAALAGLVHLGVFSSTELRSAMLWACSHWPERSERKDRDTIERAMTFGLANPRNVEIGESRV